MLTFSIIINDERDPENPALKHIFIQCDEVATPITLKKTDIQVINSLYNEGFDGGPFFTKVPEIDKSVLINWHKDLGELKLQ